jgi:hypothetical protein
MRAPWQGGRLSDAGRRPMSRGARTIVSGGAARRELSMAAPIRVEDVRWRKTKNRLGNAR